MQDLVIVSHMVRAYV